MSFCGIIDVIGSVSSTVSLVLGNIPATKHLTLITGSVIVKCCSVRYYCKNMVHFADVPLLPAKVLKSKLASNL